jgi:hypothetical protein
MILFWFARLSHWLQEANSAVVCSIPPSWVGIGIEELEETEGWVKGRKYMYICVVKRFGRFGGVTHLVKGMSDSAIILASVTIIFKVGKGVSETVWIDETAQYQYPCTQSHLGINTGINNTSQALNPINKSQFSIIYLLSGPLPFRLIHVK